MIKINLLPPEKKLFGPLQQEITLFSVIVIFVVVLAGLVSAYEKNKIGEIRSAIGVLDQDLNKLSEIAKNVETLEKNKAFLVQRMDVIKKIVSDRNVWPRFLDDLSRRLPEGLWFTNFSQNDGKTITLSGFSFTNLLLARFMQSMEKSPFIERVELDYAQKVTQGEEDTVKFQIMLVLKQNM